MDVQERSGATAVTVTAVVGLVISALVCAGVAFVGMFSGMLSAGCAPEAAARCDDIAGWMIGLTFGGAPIAWVVGMIMVARTRTWSRAVWGWSPALVAVVLLFAASRLEQYAYSLN